MSPVRVDTAPYEATHKRRPRGAGVWTFTARPEGGHGAIRLFTDGPYGQALRWAEREARRSLKRRDIVIEVRSP